MPYFINKSSSKVNLRFSLSETSSGNHKILFTPDGSCTNANGISFSGGLNAGGIIEESTQGESMKATCNFKFEKLVIFVLFEKLTFKGVSKGKMFSLKYFSVKILSFSENSSVET